MVLMLIMLPSCNEMPNHANDRYELLLPTTAIHGTGARFGQQQKISQKWKQRSFERKQRKS
jgi:hypothetical protein